MPAGPRRVASQATGLLPAVLLQQASRAGYRQKLTRIDAAASEIVCGRELRYSRSVTTGDGPERITFSNHVTRHGGNPVPGTGGGQLFAYVIRVGLLKDSHMKMRRISFPSRFQHAHPF